MRAVEFVCLSASVMAAAGIGISRAVAAEPPASLSEAVAIAARLAKAEGSPAAPAAQADRLSLIEPEMLLPCLAAFAETTPGGANWLAHGLDRAVERMAGRLPLDAVAGFVIDDTRPAAGRVLASEWLEKADPPRAAAAVAGMIDDPALPLRYKAIDARLTAAAAAGPEAELAACRGLLGSARDVEQVERIAARLEQAGEAVDVAEVLGFLRRWRLSEPFDNRGGVGFAKVYPPEAAATPDTDSWREVAAEGPHGEVDLNGAIGTKKGVLAYAAAEVDMPRGRTAEVRIGSPCAVAVWVNGEPVMAHEIYHASEAIDQYVAEAEFRAGTNLVLVKCCQNEQTEPWAGEWKFQLRICDPLGTPLGVQP